MKLTRISDEEIARALETLKMFKGKDLSDTISDSDRVVAQAQLESCEKEAQEKVAMIVRKGNCGR